MTPMEMARQAVNYLPETDYEPILHTKEQIDRFAEIVRKDERDRRFRFSPCDAKKLESAFENSIEKMLENAVLAEREACAKVCDTVVKMMDGTVFPETCAAAIRARGEK